MRLPGSGGEVTRLPEGQCAMKIPSGLAIDESEKDKALDPIDRKPAAIAFLREWLYPLERSRIRTLLGEYGHGKWIWHLHDEKIAELYPDERKYAIWLGPRFGFGMQVRNALRHAGFGEEALSVPDLDDVYVDLLEAAVQDRTDPDG